jgi:hypothetical protein
MRKRQAPDGQASLFESRPATAPSKPAVKAAAPHARTWTMPVVEGRTVAEIRLRWTKRMTPAQVARVEAELSALPHTLTKLGFGSVQVEHAFVRRRKS